MRSVLTVVLALCLAGTAFAGSTGGELIAPATEVFDFRSGSVEDLTPETVDKIRIAVEAIVANVPRSVVIRNCIDYGGGQIACPIDRISCQRRIEEVECGDGMVYNPETDRCEGESTCVNGSFNASTGLCENRTTVPENLLMEWDYTFGNKQGWVETTNARFYVEGGFDIYDFYPLTIKYLTAKNGKNVASTVRYGSDNFVGYIAVVSSDNTIYRDLLYTKCSSQYCLMQKEYEWGSVLILIYDLYNGYTDVEPMSHGILDAGKHMIGFNQISYIQVNPGYKVGYFLDYWQSVEFLWTKDESELQTSAPSCITGEPNYDGICVEAPTCTSGVFDGAVDGCYVGDFCPIDPTLDCVGPSGSKWCSPYQCNMDGMCGVAECVQGEPSLSAPLMDRDLYFRIRPGAGATGECREASCDLVTWRDIAYCVETRCPQGFGVFEENDECYKMGCPPGSREINGECYKDQQ